MRHQSWWPGRFEYGVACSTPSGAERAVVEDDEATPRGNAEEAGSRAAAVVATTLGIVAVAEAETGGGVKWQTVLQGENRSVMSRSTTMICCQVTMEASDA